MPAFLTGDKLELKADHVDINPHYAERCARFACFLFAFVLFTRTCTSRHTRHMLSTLSFFCPFHICSMEIETFTMHLDFEHTFAEDDATGTFLTTSADPLRRFEHNINSSNLLSAPPISAGGGRLQLHALDPSKQHALPVYNNSGMAGFEAGLEEVSLCRWVLR